MVWRFEHTGRRTGAYNMEYDERRACALCEADGPSTLRVYGWEPPAISLGWHQSLEEIDVQKCAEAGIDVVRRPTGGRAILHSEELTYSVIMIAERAGVLDAYRRISRALAHGLRTIGIDARFEKSQPHFPSLYRLSSSAACFSSAARHEIHVNGRKLVGSAQRRFAHASGSGAEVLLQHGSVLLGPDHLRIVDFLRIDGEESREALRRELEDKTIDLFRLLGRRIAFEEVAQAVQRGFEDSWGIKFEDAETHPRDSRIVTQPTRHTSAAVES